MINAHVKRLNDLQVKAAEMLSLYNLASSIEITVN
jgi:hypothetical protein